MFDFDVDETYFARKTKQEMDLFFDSISESEVVSFCEWRFINASIHSELTEYEELERHEIAVIEGISQADRDRNLFSCHRTYELVMYMYEHPNDVAQQALYPGETLQSLKIKVEKWTG